MQRDERERCEKVTMMMAMVDGYHKANKMRWKFLISTGEKSKSCEKHFQVRQLHDIKRPKRTILLHRKIFISSLTSSPN